MNMTLKSFRSERAGVLGQPVYVKKPFVAISPTEGCVLFAFNHCELDEVSSYYDDSEVQLRTTDLEGSDNTKVAPKLTIESVRAVLRQYNCTLTHKDGEFRVRLIGSPADQGYFTDDLEDAQNTGKAMMYWGKDSAK